MKQKFDVKGMSCAACVKHVEDAVKKVDGVKTCMVSLTSSTMLLDYDGNSDEVIKAVKKAGYSAKLAGKDQQKKQEPNTILIRIVVSAFFLLLLMYVSMGHMWGWAMPAFLHDPLTNAITQLCLCFPCLIANYKYFFNGITRLVRFKPDMDSLVSVGAGAAFVSGIVTLCVSRGVGHLYFESAAMIVTLVTVGKFFEARSKKKTNDALEKLMALTPETATRINGDGKEETVPAESLVVGDKVVVKQGERIPCDGVATEGEGYADESAMTGESMPKEIKKGEKMHGGTTLVSGYVVMEATGTGAETTLAQIIEMVENANMTKPRLARIADKVAGMFVPVVMGLALITFAGWAIAGKLSDGLQCAIAVLVVSCPCALGLATPVAVTVGTGKGAKKGILFRSGEALENLCKIKKVVFDKTGTVTEGKPKVEFIQAEGDEEKLLRVAAAAEKKSSHPLAQAVVEYVEERMPILECDDFSAEFGKGVSAALDGKTYFVGKADFVKNNAHVDFSLNEGIATTVYVASEGEYLGCIGISDAVRTDSKEGIAQLKKLGVTPSLLTGDNEKVAKKVADSVGIEEVISDVLPDKKAEVIEKYKNECSVAMVGDGINDAPALAVADVGIAVGGGSEIAKGNADVVLMSSSLVGVGEALLISKDTVRNIKQNLFWAFFYNILGIPVAAGVLYPVFSWTMNPMIASAAMSLSSLFVVSNALRYKYVHGGKMMFGKKKQEDGIVLRVEGMMCEHCKGRVEQALRSVGIDGKVDLKKKTVTCPIGTDETAAKKAITEAGYEVK